MPRRTGLTVIEVVIALAVVAVLTLMVVPNLGKWIQHHRMRGVARDIVSQMELAKIRALKTNREYQIAFDKVKKEFWLERGNRPDASRGWVPEGGVFSVPHQIAFDVTADKMEFNPDGTASSGTVTIGSTDGEHYTITVETSTGKINTEREN
jgi:Tfp pilus assembly protein FimT